MENFISLRNLKMKKVTLFSSNKEVKKARIELEKSTENSYYELDQCKRDMLVQIHTKVLD